MTHSREYIEGYQSPIKRGVWERVQRMGAPRVWSVIWACLCAYIGLLFLTLLGVRYVPVPLVVWALGQGGLILLTKMDIQWDDVALAHLTRRYKGYYNAG